jgi:hypothetical protein
VVKLVNAAFWRPPAPAKHMQQGDSDNQSGVVGESTQQDGKVQPP